MLRTFAVLLALAATADALPLIVLYDGTIGGGSTPGSQGWPLITAGSASEVVGGGGVTVTTDLPAHSGYTRTSPVALDRNISYNLTFDLQLLSETHISGNRAGLSILVIGNDLNGIELLMASNSDSGPQTSGHRT